MGAQQPCCQGACQTAGLEKYYSVAKSMTGVEHCGECCMDPKKYKLYHFFEKNLTKATDDSPCKGFGFTKYDSTVTHGFGPVKMTLDLYDKPSEEPSFLADAQFVKDPVSCMKSKCPSQIAACTKDAKCSALIACAEKCKPGDSACVTACAKGNLDGAVLAMVSCAKTNGCFKSSTEAKLASSAPAQCKTDADCPCAYCMNDSSKKPPYFCHAQQPGVCCKTDKDCPGS